MSPHPQVSTSHPDGIYLLFVSGMPPGMNPALQQQRHGCSVFSDLSNGCRPWKMLLNCQIGDANRVQACCYCNSINAYFAAQSSRVRPFALTYTPRQYLQYMMMLQAQQGAAAQAAPPPTTAPSTDPQQCLGCEDKAQDIIQKSTVLWFFHRWTFKNVCWMFTSSSRKISQLTKIFVKWVETTSPSKSHVVEARVKYATRLQICPLPLTEGLLVSLRFFQGPRLWGREDCIEMGKCQKHKDLSPHRIKSTTFTTTLNKAPWG